MIQCDNLDNKLVFSDDRALLPEGFNGHVQQWLSEYQPHSYLMLREPSSLCGFSFPPDDLSLLISKTFIFWYRRWQLNYNNNHRLFLAAVCQEHNWQILGPEIDPKDGHVIAPSPVVEVVIREEDQPPASIQSLAKLSAEVWATLSDEERERHPKIGEVAACLDLDGLL